MLFYQSLGALSINLFKKIVVFPTFKNLSCAFCYFGKKFLKDRYGIQHGFLVIYFI